MNKSLQVLFSSWSTSRNNQIFDYVKPIDDSIDLNYAILITLISLQNKRILLKLIANRLLAENIFYLPKEIWNIIQNNLINYILKIYKHHKKIDWSINSRYSSYRYYSYGIKAIYQSFYTYDNVSYYDDGVRMLVYTFYKIEILNNIFNIYIPSSDIRININAKEFNNDKYLDLDSYIEYMSSNQVLRRREFDDKEQNNKLKVLSYKNYYEDFSDKFQDVSIRSNKLHDKKYSKNHKQRTSKKKNSKKLYMYRKKLSCDDYEAVVAAENSYYEDDYSNRHCCSSRYYCNFCY